MIDDLNTKYPGNSIYQNTEQQNRERLKPVTKNLVSYKKSITQQIKEAFIGEDIVNNIIIPGAENLILDGLEQIFFKRNTRRGNYQQSYYSSQYYGNPSYNNYYQYSYQQEPPQPQYQYSNKPDYRSIIVRTKQDADMVVRGLIDRIQECRYASVSDLFDLVGCPGDYTDSDWGWMTPRGIGVRRVSQGFLIVVPDAQPIMR